jgi:hypothetical protein
MLTDAEMDALLKQKEQFCELIPDLGGFIPHRETKKYCIALDAALPKLVAEIRRLRCSWVCEHVHIDEVVEMDEEAIQACYESNYS